MNELDRYAVSLENMEVLRAQVEEQAREIERLRMQLVACGVVALANTPESAAKARDMHPDYMSASCGDVIRTVDIQMQLRAELAALKAKPSGVVLPDRVAMAKALCKHHAEQCGVNADDQWKVYSENFFEDVDVMLAAAPSAGSQKEQGE